MYAQVRKTDNVVALIGGEEVGLPIEHPDVLCIDIGENEQGVSENWTYFPEEKRFDWIPINVDEQEMGERVYTNNDIVKLIEEKSNSDLVYQLDVDARLTDMEMHLKGGDLG